MSEIPEFSGLLVIPRLGIQNANAISSPMTWGFPSMTAFLGLMWALERKLCRIDPEFKLIFKAVGVVCHRFEPQVSGRRSIRRFSLTRNPLEKDGGTASIVEEGRAHLDLTLIFGVDGAFVVSSEEERKKIARDIGEMIGMMRIAGGTVVSGPDRPPSLFPVSEDFEARRVDFMRLRRHWLPGFSLISRDDLLQERFAEMRQENPDTTILDAWMDLSRNNVRAIIKKKGEGDESKESVDWVSSRQKGKGWLVPIPIGYGSLSDLYPAGSVADTRDRTTPVRFVESAYSIGEWIGPHHLSDVRDLLWYGHHDARSGLYRCVNGYSVAQKSKNKGE